MKVFFDTNIIIDTTIRVEKYPDSAILLNNLLDTPGFSLWISTITINNTEYIVSRLGSKEKVQDVLTLLNEEFSIIPFRKSVFVKALKTGGPDFEDAIQMASAEEMGMDYLVTRNKDHFKGSKVPVVTPSEFLEKWNAGEFDTVTHVPFLDLKAQHHQVYNEIDNRITEIISNTAFILGKHVDEFETRFAQIQGAKYCIGVSSGTDALHIALMTLGIGPGDKAIVPVNTFIATAEAVSLCGAEPVFIDCDEYYNISISKLKEYLKNLGNKPGNRIPKAIIPVHLYGQPADMDAILKLAQEYDMAVVEDCCQAHLARYMNKLVGNLGQFGAFSFYPGKNLGAYGEAGALVTNDEKLYIKAKMIRQHGEIERYQHQLVGHNYRMEALQGAVLSAKLPYLEEWTEKRRANAKLYNDLLKNINGIQIPKEIPDIYAVYHLYVIQCDNRDVLKNHLHEKGVMTGLHYPKPLHLQPAYAALGYSGGDFPLAESSAQRILSLPMYPELTKSQIKYVADCIKEYMK